MRNKDDSIACVILSCVPLVGEENSEQQWKGSRGICRNVAEERENESALARALGVTGCRIYRRGKEDSFRIAAEHGNVDGLESLDTKLAALDTSDKLLEIEIGKWKVLAAATNYRQRINGAISIWKPTGDKPWDDDHLLLISDVANQLGIANEQISNHERIWVLSRTDSMTGLLNRRAFYEEDLPRRISRLQRSRETAALFFVDMDNFKRVNDVHGHQAGDDAILILRDLLMEMSRPGDVIARLGGDEFAMWLDGISPEVSENRAGRLIYASECLRKLSGDDDHPLGISVGVAIFDPDDDESLDDIMARADAAMYEVKNSGKSGFHMAAPPERRTDSTEGVKVIEKPSP